MKWICILLSIIASVYGYAQSVQVDRAIFSPGDTLYHATDQLALNIHPTPPGDNRVWDFSKLMSAFIRQRVVEPVIPELLPGPLSKSTMKLEDMQGLDRYYRFKEGKIECLGQELKLTDKVSILAWFDPPVKYEEQLNYPERNITKPRLITEAKPPGFFHQIEFTRNINADSIRLIYQLNIQRTTDAFGILKLPAGVYDVVRERVIVNARPQLMVKHGHKWQPYTMGDNLPEWARSFEERKDYLWARGYTEPIALVETDGKGFVSRIYYQAPRWSGKLINETPSQKDVFAYPNPSFGPVRFDFFNLPDDTYTLEIFNILGMKLMSRTVDLREEKTIQLDLSSLKKGTYIYRLLDGDNNTIRSKRLVIISP